MKQVVLLLLAAVLIAPVAAQANTDEFTVCIDVIACDESGNYFDWFVNDGSECARQQEFNCERLARAAEEKVCTDSLTEAFVEIGDLQIENTLLNKKIEIYKKRNRRLRRRLRNSK